MAKKLWDVHFAITGFYAGISADTAEEAEAAGNAHVSWPIDDIERMLMTGVKADSYVTEVVPVSESGEVLKKEEPKTAYLLLMVDGDLGIDVYVIDKETAAAVEDGDDEEAEEAIEDEDGVLHKCSSVMGAVEWAAANGYKLVDELHRATT